MTPGYTDMQWILRFVRNDQFISYFSTLVILITNSTWRIRGASPSSLTAAEDPIYLFLNPSQPWHSPAFHMKTKVPDIIVEVTITKASLATIDPSDHVPTCSWKTILHRFLMFLYVSQAEALTAFVPNYLFKNRLYWEQREVLLAAHCKRFRFS